MCDALKAALGAIWRWIAGKLGSRASGGRAQSKARNVIVGNGNIVTVAQQSAQNAPDATDDEPVRPIVKRSPYDKRRTREEGLQRWEQFDFESIQQPEPQKRFVGNPVFDGAEVGSEEWHLSHAAQAGLKNEGLAILRKEEERDG